MELNGLHNRISVLVIDDDEEDFFIIERLFRMMKGAGYDLDWVSSSEDGIERINERRHDVYLVDYRIDGRTGIDVLAEVDALNRYEPFILLTGVGDQDTERESLQVAASDYLVKTGLTTEALSRTIYYALGRKQQERQKIAQLLELNKTKDEFISIASHQLRTPATTVKQYVGMLAEGFAGTLTDKQQVLIAKAYDSNERQLTIINDLLKVAQIDAGHMELATQHVDVTQLLHNAVDDFLPLYANVGQFLKADIVANLSLYTDENALRMIIDNLLENAKKYSKAGAKTVVRASQNGGILEVSVIDQGVGVNAPDKLFQKFSRIENELSTEVGGTGLGLYWAKSVAKLMQGRLLYEPNTPQGSRFTMKVPIVK